MDEEPSDIEIANSSSKGYGISAKCWPTMAGEMIPGLPR
jgi:hypothetical protein